MAGPGWPGLRSVSPRPNFTLLPLISAGELMWMKWERETRLGRGRPQWGQRGSTGMGGAGGSPQPLF